MIIAGIDEAGLGPVLGPLVVSAAVFRLASAPTDAGVAPDLWSLLAGSVTRKKSKTRAAGSIVVGDSKKLFNRRKANGLVPLERGVLTMLSTIKTCSTVAPDCESFPQTATAEGGYATQRQKLPGSLGELLDAVAPGARQLAKAYRWYGPCDLPLPRQAGATDIELTSNSLRLAMRQANLELLDMRAEPVFVGEFNKLIAATNNKSTATLDITSRMLMHVCRSCPDDDLRITIDRQGGRIRYRQSLQRIFPGCELKILEECNLFSAYRIRSSRQKIEIVFRVGGEGESLAVALASMLSKYIRELCMECFNAFWAEQVEGIKPTAGYYVDGRRFYSEISEALANLGIEPSCLYRVR